MDADDRIALFTQLGVIEEKIDTLNELKPEVKANTKFRWFSTAFVIILVGFIGYGYKAIKFNDEVNRITTVERVLYE